MANKQEQPPYIRYKIQTDNEIQTDNVDEEDRWGRKPYIIFADLFGAGLGAQLILHIPNTKHVNSLKDCEFYKRLKQLEYERIDDVSAGVLFGLQKEIEDYCERSGFLNFEAEPALQLYVDDFREEYVRCKK